MQHEKFCRLFAHRLRGYPRMHPADAQAMAADAMGLVLLFDTPARHRPSSLEFLRAMFHDPEFIPIMRDAGLLEIKGEVVRWLEKEV